MFTAVDHPTLVDPNTFKLREQPTLMGDLPKKKELKEKLEQTVSEIAEIQRALFAENRWSVLAVFQAMDAAGKDSTIRSVFSGVNPAGVQVHSFRAPNDEELDHDFLWRCARRLPERGRIGVFNRSHYEEVLVVRVHENYLDGQRLPFRSKSPQIWTERLQSINDFEKHLARNGTVVLKFFLNVSQEEQKRRFIRRIDRQEKNWKFNSGDIKERALWGQYMEAYNEALSQTSKPWAPWYAIAADDKNHMRLTVAEILLKSLQSLNCTYPVLPGDESARLGELRNLLQKEQLSK